MDKSPFQILPEDAASIGASRGFQIIRSYLSACEDNQFCGMHATCDAALREEWLLHRDIIHALVMPIVQLFNRASSLAQAALCSARPDDFELAFRGDARGAFLTLQCFVGEEEDWCYTRGCPACTTSAALSTETHLRLLLASLLILVDAVIPPPSPNSPTLPSFSFFLPALRNAVAADPFWGDGFWDHLSSRAQQLCTGIQGLRTQCSELEVLVTSPATSPIRSSTAPVTETTSTAGMKLPKRNNGEIRLQKSSLAKRQTRLLREEQELLQRLAYQCWGAVALPPEIRKELLHKKSTFRRRSLTCP